MILKPQANLKSTSYLAKTKIGGGTFYYSALFFHCVNKLLPTYIQRDMGFLDPPMCTYLFKDSICDSQVHPESHLLCLQKSLAQRARMGWMEMAMTGS